MRVWSQRGLRNVVKELRRCVGALRQFPDMHALKDERCGAKANDNGDKIGALCAAVSCGVQDGVPPIAVFE